jgi:hypothetical protein
MPRVRLLVRMNILDEFHERGDSVDVPADVASSLTRLGRAVMVRGGQPDVPERAVRTEKTTRRK